LIGGQVARRQFPHNRTAGVDYGGSLTLRSGAAGAKLQVSNFALRRIRQRRHSFKKGLLLGTITSMKSAFQQWVLAKIANRKEAASLGTPVPAIGVSSCDSDLEPRHRHLGQALPPLRSIPPPPGAAAPGRR
jgi:hypothetical protein